MQTLIKRKSAWVQKNSITSSINRLQQAFVAYYMTAAEYALISSALRTLIKRHHMIEHKEKKKHPKQNKTLNELK